MFDGLFNKKQVYPPAVAQSKASTAGQQPRAPVAPAKAMPEATPVKSTASMLGPVEAAKEQVGSDFQSVVDEAAILFAGGEEKSAAEMLIDYLKKTNGQANRRVWFMLLDIYQALDQKDQYEKLSLMFANRFGTSPPSWEEAVGENIGQSLSATSASVGKIQAASGRNVMIIEGAEAEQLSAKSKEFLAASKELKSCKLDISRMKIDQVSIENIVALHNLMKLLRKYNIAATLMGENHVATWLDKKIKETKGGANPNDSPFWMLLLEILQWRGLMEVFEELSLDYTITFEISGPGWEPTGVMTIETVVENEEDHGLKGPGSGDIYPDETITDISIQRMQESIVLAIAEKGSAKLDFRKVKRMAFSSAGAFSSMLAAMGANSRNVTMVNPSELILVLGDVVGFGPYVTIVPRKR